MKKTFAAWFQSGQHISIIIFYSLSFALTVLLDAMALIRLLTGHTAASVSYFACSIAFYALFVRSGSSIRKDDLQWHFQKGFLLLVCLFLFGLTFAYFLDGGLAGGSFFLFVLAFALMPCFFRIGRSAFYMCLMLCVCFCNITLGVFFPASVRGTGYQVADFFVPFFVTVLPLGMVILLYTHAYHRQKNNLADALREADAAVDAKSRFLDNMSHEIRTPMNTLLGMNEMILREEDRPEIREYAAQIQRSGLALLSVINDILDYSRIQDHRMKITPIRYDVSSLINDMVNIALDYAKRKSLEFQVFADRELPRILIGDEYHIRQIILNILNNAVKYTERGGVTFRVGFNRTDKENEILLRVSVSDTGVGIREEDMEQIFQPFEQASGRGTFNAEGAGLGLSIARSLLELMDSTLEISSERGVGSTFSFALRQQFSGQDVLGDYTHAFREASVHNRELPQHRFTAPDAHVLVVDDTPVNLVVFRNLLKDTGIKIDTATSGEEMLQMARIHHYDAIFLDHRMPGMDGIEAFHALERIRDQKNQMTPVIALTANAVPGARQMYLDEGFADYLPKPVDSVRLMQLLHSRLNKDLIHEADEADASLEDAETHDLSGTGADADDPFRHLQGIDYDAAVANCGGEAIFREAVQVFYETIDENADKIEQYAAQKQFRDYTILVHALKSSARLIGALDLSADALHLEEAGNAEDEKEIEAKTPKLLSDYRSLRDILKVVCGKDEDALPEMEQDTLSALYDKLRLLMEDFDLDGLDEALKETDGYAIPENEHNRFERVKIAVRNADWGELEDALR